MYIMEKIYSLKQTASLLDINIQTLRRWDKSGRFVAKRKSYGKIKHYYYHENDIEDFLNKEYKLLLNLARNWTSSNIPKQIISRFYCADKSIFKARLSRLEFDLNSIGDVQKTLSLVVAITGEIGNNAFDHNLGNWPDVNGIFFSYNLKEKKVILADRGQGVLKTLKKVKPELLNHNEALETAFTEIISSRSPEARGNGLKFVKEVVVSNNFKLFFQSGDAILNLKKNDSDLKIIKSSNFIRGCFIELSF